MVPNFGKTADNFSTILKWRQEGSSGKSMMHRYHSHHMFSLEYDAQFMKDLCQVFHYPLPPFPNGCVSLDECSIFFLAYLPDWIGTVFPVKWMHLTNLFCADSFACSVEGGHVRWASSSMSKLDLCNPWGSGCEEQGCVRCCGSTWCSGPGACSWHSW